MMEKLVTVIITTFKTKGELKRAIQSLLNQTYDNVEIIVVDDNEPNTKWRCDTEAIMQRFSNNDHIIYIKHSRNMNGSAARNTGIKKAKGDYICFLDDDDEYMPKRIEKCVELLEGNTEYDSVLTNVCIKKNGKTVLFHEVNTFGNAWRELLLDDGILGTGSNIFIRRNVVDDIGYFDEEFQRHQDLEFMLRVLEKHKVFSIRESLIVKHLEDKNAPEYNKIVDIKKQYFKKFNYLIEQLENDEKNAFYANQYAFLFRYALKTNNRQYIMGARKNLEKYRKLSYLEDVLYFFPWMFKPAQSLYRKSKKIFFREKRANHNQNDTR